MKSRSTAGKTSSIRRLASYKRASADRLDPTRLTTYRRAFASALQQRLERLSSLLYRAVSVDDALNLRLVDNAFCPTGEGGGVDDTCSPRPKKAKMGKAAVASVKATLSEGAKDAVKLYLKKIVLHATQRQMDAALKQRYGKEAQLEEGQHRQASYDRREGTLHITADTPEEVIAHELGHVVDGPTESVSGSPEFIKAWKKEAGRLSTYAGSHPAEGLAEMYRLRHLHGREYVEKLAPKMAAAVGSYRWGEVTKNADLLINLSVAELEAAPAGADPSPTLSQKEAGNYKKGHVWLQGLPITIETAKGNRRKPTHVPLKHHYGYIKRTESEADGDHVDVFLGPYPDAPNAYIVDQYKQDGHFDEHKCLVGFRSKQEAETAYRANYPSDWTGFGGITELPMPLFKLWLKEGDTGKPMAGGNEPASVITFHKDPSGDYWRDEATGTCYVREPVANARWEQEKRDKAGRWTRSGSGGGATSAALQGVVADTRIDKARRLGADEQLIKQMESLARRQTRLNKKVKEGKATDEEKVEHAGIAGKWKELWDKVAGKSGLSVGAGAAPPTAPVPTPIPPTPPPAPPVVPVATPTPAPPALPSPTAAPTSLPPVPATSPTVKVRVGREPAGKTTPGQHQARLERMLTKHLKSLKKAKLPDYVKDQYAQALTDVLKRMPPEALRRTERGLKKIVWHLSVDEVTAAYASNYPGSLGKGERVNGYYKPKEKETYLDGVTSKGHAPGFQGDTLNITGTYAHELGHAIDSMGKTDVFVFSKGGMSNSKGWMAAYRAEIAKGWKRDHRFAPSSVDPDAVVTLSRYAQTEPCEGFAEFSRLLYGTKADIERAKRQFPKCFAFFKKKGLWVEPISNHAPSAPVYTANSDEGSGQLLEELFTGGGVDEASGSVWDGQASRGYVENYNTDESRDKRGRWAKGGDAGIQRADKRAQSILSQYAGKVNDLANRIPVVGQLKAGLQKLMGGIHSKLADRYGEKAANVIMASGSLGGYGVMAASVKLLGFTVPVVTDLVSITAHVAVAEGMYQLGILKGGKKQQGKDEVHNAEGEALTPEQIKRLGKLVWQKLGDSLVTAWKSKRGELETALRDVNADGSTTSTRNAFAGDVVGRLSSFRTWLETTLTRLLVAEEFARYLSSAYLAGATRSFDDVYKPHAQAPINLDLGKNRIQLPLLPYEGAKDHFFRRLGAKQIGRPKRLGGTVLNARHSERDVGGKFISQKTALLVERLRNDFKGLTARIATKVGRLAADTVQQGKSRHWLVRQIKQVTDLEGHHALTIADTALTHANAEGSLDALEELGVPSVAGVAEWATQQGACELCEALDGAVFTVEEARGLLPRHPRCKCRWSAVDSPTVRYGRKKTLAKVAESVDLDLSGRWAGEDLVGNTDQARDAKGRFAAMSVAELKEHLRKEHGIRTSGTKTQLQELAERKAAQKGGSGSGSGSGEPPIASSQKQATDHHAQVAQALHQLKGKYGDVKLADLRDRLGHLPLEKIHEAVKELWRKGHVGLSEIEGRGGVSSRDLETAIHVPSSRSHGLGSRMGVVTVLNAASFFADCERDEGGHCLPSGSGGSATSEASKQQLDIYYHATVEEFRATQKQALAKALAAAPPTKQEKKEAIEGIKKLGANKYRRNLVGNTKNRATRRKALLEEFGDGKTCPCVYCGLKIGEGTLEQDKIYTTAQGGRYRVNNLLPCCSACNKARGDLPFEKIKWPEEVKYGGH